MDSAFPRNVVADLVLAGSWAICGTCGLGFEPTREFDQRYCGLRCLPERGCETCGGLYKPKRWGQRYCSRKCTRGWAKKRGVRTCEGCGKVFEAKQDDQRYCGYGCSNSATQRKVWIGKGIEERKAQGQRLRTAREEWVRTPESVEERTCQRCGTGFTTRLGSRAKYCRRCREEVADERWREAGRQWVKVHRKPRYGGAQLSLFKRVFRNAASVRGKRKRWAEIRAWLVTVKATIGCYDCGLRIPAILDFHHFTGIKKSEVAKCKTFTSALRELAKCIVLCRNCHGLQHANGRVRDRSAPSVADHPAMPDLLAAIRGHLERASVLLGGVSGDDAEAPVAVGGVSVREVRDGEDDDAEVAEGLS